MLLAGAGTVTVRLDTSCAIDVAAEIARVQQGSRRRGEGGRRHRRKLGNPQFLQKAKPEAVDKIRERAAQAAADVSGLTERLATLRVAAR